MINIFDLVPKISSVRSINSLYVEYIYIYILPQFLGETKNLKKIECIQYNKILVRKVFSYEISGLIKIVLCKAYAMNVAVYMLSV